MRPQSQGVEIEESGPGTVPDWDYINARAVYDEYEQSPYQNYKSHA